MRIHEILSEKIIDVKGTTVIENPSRQQVINYLDRAREKELRGTILSKTILIWDAYDAEHQKIDDYLGHYGSQIDFFITQKGHQSSQTEWSCFMGKGKKYYESDKVRVVFSSQAKEPLNNPLCTRLMKLLNINPEEFIYSNDGSLNNF